VDLFVVPTISFRLLYGFLILQHSGRQLLWPGVIASPRFKSLRTYKSVPKVIIQPEEGRLAFMPTELSDLVQNSTLYY
jgi:hypothetical protein